MVMTQATLVLGASLNPHRYSHQALLRLQEKGYKTFAMGLNQGKIGAVTVLRPFEKISGVHTVSLYLKPDHQGAYLDYLLHLKPQRVIFNPGTENPSLAKQLTQRGIACENACTLVLLSTDQYEPQEGKESIEGQ
jgi:predicted CoA-binding protein